MFTSDALMLGFELVNKKFATDVAGGSALHKQVLCYSGQCPIIAPELVGGEKKALYLKLRQRNTSANCLKLGVEKMQEGFFFLVGKNGAFIFIWKHSKH